MDRRTFFISGAGALSAGVSGCLTDGSRGEENREDTPTVDSRFSGEECPSFRDTGETRCYHEVGEQPDVYIAPEKEAGDPTEEAIKLALYNDSDGSVWSCPLSECWNLHKLVEGEWLSITPFKDVPLMSEPLDAGDSYSWDVRMTDEIVGQRNLSNPEPSEMVYTGPGRYAFTVSVSMEEGGGGDEIELVTLLELEGDPLEIEPSGAEEYEKETGTVRARTESYDEEDRLVLSATRSEEAVAEVEPIPTELAVQIYPVRNTLALFENETQEVRLEGGSSLIDRMEDLRRAANVYEASAGGTLIHVTEDGSAEDYPYRFRFLYEGDYYDINPVEVESSDS
jgi:hypothetical protein